MEPWPEDSGVIRVPSAYAVADATDRLEAVLRERGMTIFVRIDQQREAERVGLKLRPTQLLLFGNPRAGTLIMQAAPSAAIDLPLKALVWQDDSGQVWIGYDDPAYLQHRHHLSAELTQQIAGVGGLINAARGS
jgi:uncharacterized protein (DUF302 family)